MTDKSNWKLARAIYEARYPDRGGMSAHPHWDALPKHERAKWLACAEAASPSPPPSAGVDAVAVKALEWQDEYLTEDGIRATTAKSAFARYIAAENGFFLLGAGQWVYATSLDEAKAAAQADYEARIRSALTPAPTPVEAGGEAVLAAQIAARDSNGCGCAHGRETVFCDDPRLPAPGVECQCKKDALAAVKAYSAALAKPASEPADGAVREAEILRQAADIVERLTWHNSETIARRMRDAALSAPASSSPAEEQADV